MSILEQDFYVDGSRVGAPGNGLTPATAFQTLGELGVALASVAMMVKAYVRALDDASQEILYSTEQGTTNHVLSLPTNPTGYYHTIEGYAVTPGDLGARAVVDGGHGIVSNGIGTSSDGAYALLRNFEARNMTGTGFNFAVDDTVSLYNVKGVGCVTGAVLLTTYGGLWGGEFIECGRISANQGNVEYVRIVNPLPCNSPDYHLRGGKMFACMILNARGTGGGIYGSYIKSCTVHSLDGLGNTGLQATDVMNGVSVGFVKPIQATAIGAGNVYQTGTQPASFNWNFGNTEVDEVTLADPANGDGRVVSPALYDATGRPIGYCGLLPGAAGTLQQGGHRGTIHLGGMRR